LTGSEPKHDLQIGGSATPEQVRAMLAALRAHLVAHGAGDALCGTVELTVAEALNNIAEHAYAGQTPGPVRLTARLAGDALTVTLCDHGTPLPGLAIPRTRLPDATGPRHTLPEGGFGWHLIQRLTRSLGYTREDGQNLLTLEFANNPD